MKSQESNSKTTENHISDSNSKTARGSKNIHSKKDSSSQDGFIPEKKSKSEEE